MAGLPAFGTELRRGNGADPQVYTKVAELGDLEGPGMSTTTFDVSSHSSPGAVMEKAAGMIDAGEITVPINWDPSAPTHETLYSDLISREVVSYQIAWPTTPQVLWTIPCIVTGFQPSAPVNDKLSAEVTLTVAGLPVITDAV